MKDFSDAADRARHFSSMCNNEIEQFEAMVRSICPVGGSPDEYGVRLGNVEFWIDSEGPWAGKLSHSIPTSQWDTPRVAADLTARLMEAKIFHSHASGGGVLLRRIPVKIIAKETVGSADWAALQTAMNKIMVAARVAAVNADPKNPAWGGSSTVYVKETSGWHVRALELQEESLSDGSKVFNVILLF